MKFYRYKPLTLDELKGFDHETPPEINDDPIYQEYNKTLKIWYSFTPLNPFGKQKFLTERISISLMKKWNGRIDVHCANINIQEAVGGYFRYQFKEIFNNWDREPIQHWKFGKRLPDDEKYCHICYISGRYNGMTCNKCTNVKKYLARMRDELANSKSYIDTMRAKAKSIEEKMAAFTYLSENVERTNSDIARAIVRDEI